ncbi:MAG TPA: hypothetical protein V6D14_02410 [Coleofasciculaceae cyanobacterium]
MLEHIQRWQDLSIDLDNVLAATIDSWILGDLTGGQIEKAEGRRRKAEGGVSGGLFLPSHS